MARARVMCALALAIAVATAATITTTTTWAGPPDLQNRWVGPIPPRETIYVPECWRDDDFSHRCGGGERIRP
jgi:hypothetical protein